MDIKKRPIPTKKTSAINNNHDNTPAQFQCPRCGCTGQTELFTLGWKDHLYNLAVAYPGQGISISDIELMTVSDQYGAYLYLKRVSSNGR